MMTATPTRPWFRALIGLTILHLVVSLRYEWEGVSIPRGWLVLSPDLVLLVGAGLALSLACGVRRTILHPFTVAVLFIPLYRFGVTIMPTFYGKAFIPYEDVLMVPGLIHLLTHEFAEWIQWSIYGGALLILIAIYYGLYRCSRAVFKLSLHRRSTFFILAVCQALLLLVWGQKSAGVPQERRAWGPTILGQAYEDLSGLPRFIKAYQDFLEHLTRTERRVAGLPQDLSLLRGTDVYIIFIESYGRVLFRKPDSLQQFEAGAAPLMEALEAAGFYGVTGFIYPSVIGGGSSLAHAEFLSGAPVANRLMFDTLLESSLKPLPKFFQQAGYRTLNVQPAMTIDWPEGDAFFGFSDEIFQQQMHYAGHHYHWGLMPDQFALAHLLKTAVRPATQPLFAMYVSVISHAPFNMIPPYLDDWHRAAEPDAFDQPPAREYDIDWSTYLNDRYVEEAYVESILYSLKTAVGFCEQLERPSLLLVLGDHQPPSVGNMIQYDRTALVPLHVISNRPELLLPFHQLGFQLGLVPGANAASYSSSEFLPAFLNFYGKGGE